MNEENYILLCIKSALSNSRSKPEIIVIDAGSDDDTLKIISDFEELILVSKSQLRGRKYASLNLGASMASGDIFLFLDADTILPKAYDELIFKTISPTQRAGAFNLTFDNSGIILNTIAFLNSLRYRLTKRFFGDQAIFCTKELFNKVNGFPRIRIMEAARFCQLLKSETKLKLINESVISSSRRFEKQGVLKAFIIDLKILIKDVFNMNLSKEGEAYWNKIDR